ncbi:hypothetical protein BKA67DRAFT_571161 [Truncatella angustata]|uniref:Uncharacterized protein n=1 Tax=Truncatella angustata TaxID=152316 RepID=A0A9P8UG25_9PEZI|nr:uncharacterized protein BKA67DRAFT_571161 [Truncatella angustata]KAH6651535.1 hypothetical protein BKA67DRAFT_571161 [Truncatella angustata]
MTLRRLSIETCTRYPTLPGTLIDLTNQKPNTSTFRPPGQLLSLPHAPGWAVPNHSISRPKKTRKQSNRREKKTISSVEVSGTSRY